MARKRDPESDVVAFFETAPIESAQIVLNIVRGIVARRAGRSTPTRGRKTTRPTAVEEPAPKVATN